MPCDDLERRDVGMGRRSKREGVYVYIIMNLPWVFCMNKTANVDVTMLVSFSHL